MFKYEYLVIIYLFIYFHALKHSQRDFLQGLSAKAAIGKAKVFLKLLVHGVFLKLLVHGVYKKFFALASSKEFLDTQVAIECGFTLKRLRDMTRTYSQVF